MKKKEGVSAITANVAKIKAEAERLEVMDKAAGILAELLYTKDLLTDIKEYRTVMIHVSLMRWFGQIQVTGQPDYIKLVCNVMFYVTCLWFSVCCWQSEGSEVPADWV